MAELSRALVVAFVAAGCGRIGFDTSDAWLGDGSVDPDARAGFGYVQGIAVDIPTSNALSATLPHAIVAGDQLIVAVGWADASSDIVTIADSAGATFSPIAPVTRAAGLSQEMYRAVGVATASDTVTVMLSSASPGIGLRVAVYAGTSGTAVIPYIATPGTGVTGGTGPVIVSTPGSILIAADTVLNSSTSNDPAFTPRLESPSGDLIEDERAAATGPFYVTGTFGTSTDFIFQLIALVPG